MLILLKLNRNVYKDYNIKTIFIIIIKLYNNKTFFSL